MTIITTVKALWWATEFLGIFAKVCRGNGKNYGWHDMKNPGGQISNSHRGCFQPHLILKQKIDAHC